MANLTDNSSPVRRVEPRYSPQAFYSSVTALTPTFLTIRAASHTIENPHLSGIVRPLTFVAEDSFKGDVVAAAKAKVGRMFSDAISYDVSVAGWRNELNEIWNANTWVTLFAPGAYVRQRTDLIIRSVTKSRDANEDASVLNLVLPESFTGEIPSVLPWQV